MQQTDKKVCVVCGKVLSYDNSTGYCREHLIEHRRNKRLEKWLTTGNTGYGIDTTIRGPIREYIMNQQNGKCILCGQSTVWNGKELHLILDHIDGDASNSSRENLRLICPNCDSQLPTYKSRNKKSARNLRKQYIHDNYYMVE